MINKLICFGDYFCSVYHQKYIFLRYRWWQEKHSKSIDKYAFVLSKSLLIFALAPNPLPSFLSGIEQIPISHQFWYEIFILRQIFSCKYPILIDNLILIVSSPGFLSQLFQKLVFVEKILTSWYFFLFYF